MCSGLRYLLYVIITPQNLLMLMHGIISLIFFRFFQSTGDIICKCVFCIALKRNSCTHQTFFNPPAGLKDLYFISDLRLTRLTFKYLINVIFIVFPTRSKTDSEGEEQVPTAVHFEYTFLELSAVPISSYNTII